jgi:XisH protein
MAKDTDHRIVRDILINEGWDITHDPYILENFNPDWEIDLGAEKMIAAERNTEKIAVEVKGFREASFAYEFHGVVGQYIHYRIGLEFVEPDRRLILAVPVDVFETHFLRPGIRISVERNEINLMIYNPLNKKLERWISNQIK